MPWFLRVSSSSRNSCHGFLTIVSVYHRLRTHNTPKKENKFDIPTLNFTQMISRRRPLELDQIVEFEADGAKVEMRWATRVVLVRWGLAPGSVGERDERVC